MKPNGEPNKFNLGILLVFISFCFDKSILIYVFTVKDNNYIILYYVVCDGKNMYW